MIYLIISKALKCDQLFDFKVVTNQNTFTFLERSHSEVRSHKCF